MPPLNSLTHSLYVQVWGCLFLMILSALLGGVTDAQFSMRGYAWQLVNCCFTAAYSLYLSGVIRKLQRQHGRAQMSEMSMVSNCSRGDARPHSAPGCVTTIPRHHPALELHLHRTISQSPPPLRQLTPTQVYYNNLLSVPAIAVLAVISGEPWRLRHATQLGNAQFQVCVRGVQLNRWVQMEVRQMSHRVGKCCGRCTACSQRLARSLN